jgi:hypothetical protein
MKEKMNDFKMLNMEGFFGGIQRIGMGHYANLGLFGKKSFL